MALQLDLFAVLHADRVSIVHRELEKRVTETDSDAVFIEYPERRLTAVEWVTAFLQRPLVVTGFMIYALLFFPISALISRTTLPSEAGAARTLGEETNIPIHDIDPHASIFLFPGGILTIALNWIALLAVAFVFSPVRTGTTVGVVIVTYAVVRASAQLSQRLAAALSIPTFLFFFLAQITIGSFPTLVLAGIAILWSLYTTVNERNAAMLERAREVATANGYDRVVFITGQTHVSGLRDRVSNNSDLEIRTIWSRRPLRSGVLARSAENTTQVSQEN
ncbi:hypothetical protein A4G99_17635 [Haladaptatus sp. R4]|uniref:hypothetical protein n=1 Tax=Haladaptatus sp. R4 TaxID=1679489 RepID=UPI0007B46009|nr:hypothetical protein [Haladaptatus sp. R4]KZN22915.1 hypothetical protein A4G99_17635 [Haladaptatus sp. R4]